MSSRDYLGAGLSWGDVVVLFRRKDHARPRGVSPAPLAWLPGRVEVQVVGESFHLEAIARAETHRSPGSPLTAVLAPESDNKHDRHAVAVYVNGEHVGFLSREIAPWVQSALLAFSRRYQGKLASCPAGVRWSNEGMPEVVLWLDPSPLGLPPEAFDNIAKPPMTLSELLSRLDQPQPQMTGADRQSRADLLAAEKQRADIDADRDRGPQTWPTVEAIFRPLAERLERARDPFTSAAWLGVGRSVRYQRGRRGDALAALSRRCFGTAAIPRPGWNSLRWHPLRRLCLLCSRYSHARLSRPGLASSLNSRSFRRVMTGWAG